MPHSVFWFFTFVLFSCHTEITEPGPLQIVTPWKCPINAKCDAGTQELLKTAWEARNPSTAPRTRHLTGSGEPLYINQLFLENSTYLRQHAHNPVNWHPWNDETLAKAKAEHKPIFLSVGYSTCHWCHVMEEESFEDPEIASYLNQHYIAIKVDREERPDIDAIYMTAVKLIKKRGGWPMSVWLTEDAEPFYGETYIPPKNGDRGRAVGFLTLLEEFNVLYLSDPYNVRETALSLTQQIKTHLGRPTKAQLPTERTLETAIDSTRAQFDFDYGGRQGRPKFPSSFPLPFLSYLSWNNTKDAQFMLKKSLMGMAHGGIYDQLGGGFHRYSVDSRWAVPHFEKMLYDNALLISIYVDANTIFQDPYFKKIAIETIDYLIREMQHESGGFYSATDADSLTPEGHMEEGYFFTWTPSELKSHLSPDMAAALTTYYGLSEAGNIEGRNTLRISIPDSAMAEALEVNQADWESDLDEARMRLRSERENRPPPLRDDKILAGWNGLLLKSLSQAAWRFNRPDYLEHAERLGHFLMNDLQPNGVLHRSYALGEIQGVAMIEDYGAVISGFLDLFETTGNPIWLEGALDLDAVVIKEYEDPEGGWYRTPLNGESTLVREMPTFDGAEPSGASMMMQNCLRLYSLTAKLGYHDRLSRGLKRYGRTLSQNPLALDHMISIVQQHDTPPLELIIAYSGEDSMDEINEVLRRTNPHRLVTIPMELRYQEQLEKSLPTTMGKSIRNNKPTAYLCSMGSCQAPLTDLKKLTSLLKEEDLLMEPMNK